MNDKHEQYKIILENREASHALYNWLDSQKKKFKDKVLTVRCEDEDVYRSIVEQNQSRRGQQGYGDNQNYYNMQQYMMNYANYMNQMNLPNFYIRKAQGEEGEQPMGGKPRGGYYGKGERSYYQYQPQGQQTEEIEETKEGGYHRGRGGPSSRGWRGNSRGGRRGGGYRGGAGGGRYYRETFEAKEKHVINVNPEAFPSLPEEKEAPTTKTGAEPIKFKYGKDAIIKTFQSMNGKFEADETLKANEEIHKIMVKPEGYHDLELVHPSTKDRKESFHEKGK